VSPGLPNFYSNAGAGFFLQHAWCFGVNSYRLNTKLTVLIVICIIAKYSVAARGLLAIEPRRVNSAVQTKPSVTFHKNVRQLMALH
jgi:hypothetical protein